jgi:hypothetical protein
MGEAEWIAGTGDVAFAGKVKFVKIYEQFPDHQGHGIADADGSKEITVLPVFDQLIDGYHDFF